MGDARTFIEETPKELLTLAFIQKPEEDEILLGWKKRGFGKHRWNGFGGKVNPGEDIAQAAAREIEEECNLICDPSDLNKFAIFNFEFVNDPVIHEAHAYRCTKFSGEIMESEEMKPEWFSVHKLPFDKMWRDNKIWFPWLLDGKSRFRAHILFEEDKTGVVSYVFRDFNEPSHILLVSEDKRLI